MSGDYASFVAAHLARSFPDVDPFYISQFADQFKNEFFGTPTKDQMATIEDNFAIHLTVLAESVGLANGTANSQQQVSMESRQESPQSRPQPTPSPQQPARSFNPFDEEPTAASRAVDILVGIEATFSSEAAFKHLCNIIYKGVKYFVQDPTNMVNLTIPLKFEDLENNEAIFAQIQVLCSEFGIICDQKPKGALLTFSRTDPEYVRQAEQMLQAFKQHKDESVSKGPSMNAGKSGKYNPMDPNREERVQAFLEARRLRAITGPQPAVIDNFVQSPQQMTFDQQAQRVEYPAMPGNYSTPTNANPSQPTSWNGQGQDPIADRFKYKVDDSHLTRNPGLSHQNQLNEYRNKARFNNHSNIEPRNQFMTWGQLSDKIDIEDQTVLGKECLVWTNRFRESQGLRGLVWNDAIFNIGTHR